MALKKLGFKLAQRLVLQPLGRQLRGMTLGTRTAVLDHNNSVMLVRHSYSPGWFMPGGGVERGETLEQSAKREILEEAGIVAEGAMTLHGIFLNDAQLKGDHVACFVLRAFSRRDWQASLEIREAAFFPLSALPEATTGGTRRRLREITEKLPADTVW
jgi:8-oxo-dGTP pyrophosphatase MutT (NUDIX family)